MLSNQGRDPVERGPGSLGKLRLRRAQYSETIPPAGETPALRLVNHLAERYSYGLQLRSFGASGPFPVVSTGSFYVNVKIKPKGRAEPPKATAKPYSRHILGIYSGVQSHPKATPKPHQSHKRTLFSNLSRVSRRAISASLHRLLRPEGVLDRLLIYVHLCPLVVALNSLE